MSRDVAWPDGAEAWVRAALAPAHVEPVETRAAARSWVARLEAAEGRWFFKEDRSHGPSEAVVLRRLADRQSAAIAPVIAVDEARGWSLTADAGRALRVEDETEVWCEAVRRLGALQVAELPHTEAWRALGCRDLSGDRLGEAMRGLFDAAAPDLEPDVRDALRAKLPRLEDACATLAADPVPDALVHRDVVPENILVPADGPVLIDWSDVAVGHPFFACDRLLDACWTDAERKASVIDAYLAAFDVVADRETLQRSFDAVLSLRVVYEGVRWMDEIDGLDPEAEHGQRLWADALVGLRAMAGAVS